MGENGLKMLRAVIYEQSDGQIIENNLITFVWNIRFRK